jgi:hypothetical protein
VDAGTVATPESDEEEPFSETDVHLFYLVDGSWEVCDGGGRGRAGSGRGREDDSALARVEVSQPDQVTRRPVQAPVSAFVVCGEYA